VRASAVEGLGFLGLAIDPRRNADPGGDDDVSVAAAPARCLVVRSREDLEIAREVRRTLDQSYKEA
jgi:acetate kinase